MQRRSFFRFAGTAAAASFWADGTLESAETPIVNKGFITVPDKPGLGVSRNDDVTKQHLRPNTTYFGPTTQWNEDRSNDRLWS